MWHCASGVTASGANGLWYIVIICQLFRCYGTTKYIVPTWVPWPEIFGVNRLPWACTWMSNMLLAPLIAWLMPYPGWHLKLIWSPSKGHIPVSQCTLWTPLSAISILIYNCFCFSFQVLPLGFLNFYSVPLIGLNYPSGLGL